MDYLFYFSLAGFLAAFVLLFYLYSRFSETVPAGFATLPDLAPALDSVSEIQSEITGFQEQIKEMRFLLQSRRTLHERQIGDIVKNINVIVERLENIEPEHVETLQPSLQTLLSELETLRVPVAGKSK